MLGYDDFMSSSAQFFIIYALKVNFCCKNSVSIETFKPIDIIIIFLVVGTGEIESGISVQQISNGICSFNPTSSRGKAVFFMQTIVLSFLPILLLIVQNSLGFHERIKWKNEIFEKDKLVNQATVLSRFVINLQLERAMVCLAVFLDVRSGKATNLDKAYARTDQALQTVRWRKYGNEKIFQNKLRFQIRLDDFRYCT